MGHWTHTKGHEVFEPAFNSAIKALNAGLDAYQAADVFNERMDSISIYNNYNLPIERDMDCITADQLIENIDLAYTAYNRLPESFRCNHEDFLHFVLPYRATFEPADVAIRKEFYKEFSWVYAAMENGITMKDLVPVLLDSVNIKFVDQVKYPGQLPVRQLNRIRFGNCGNSVNLMIHILRSIGIAACKDYIPHWGNHHSMGHSWLTVIAPEGEFAYDTDNRQLLNDLYRLENIPKVYRNCFHVINGESINFMHALDVTDHYKDSKNVVLDVNSNKSTFELCVFNNDGNWFPVAESVSSGKKIIFKNLGPDIIYGVKKSKDLNSKTSVFYLTTDGKVKPLIPDFDQVQSANIIRKYPPFVARNTAKYTFINSLNGCLVFGANKNDLSDAEVIHEINHIKRSSVQLIKTSNSKEYNYYFVGRPDNACLFLAAFHLLNDEQQWVNAGLEIRINNKKVKGNEYDLTDDDPLTYFQAHTLNAIYHLQKPGKIRYFSIQARNDDNDVRPGDSYELLYWDNGWQSIRRETAKRDTLFYDLPANTAFWLHNHTRGVEEHIFLLDTLGNQYWPGVSALKDTSDLFKQFIN
ncbi:MAG: hypothetical protein AAGU19_10420 [Prolixibacteraceae bacterium]